MQLVAVGKEFHNGMGRGNKLTLKIQQTKGHNRAGQTRDKTTKTLIAYGNSTWRESNLKVYKLRQRYMFSM